MGDVFGDNGLLNIDRSKPLTPNPDGSYTYYTTTGGTGTARQGDRTGVVESFADLAHNAISGVTGLAKSPGYDTAAQGAKEAQAYLQQLSQTAWDRQMQGLQGALGSFGAYDALSNQLIPRHGGPSPGQGGGMPGAGGPSSPPNPSLPPPGTVPTTGYRPPVGATRTPLTPPDAPPALPPPGTPTTGYVPPTGATRTPLNPPPALPPPPSYAPPALPPPGSPVALPPPGGGSYAAPALPPPGTDILQQLALMARSGRGSF